MPGAPRSDGSRVRLCCCYCTTKLARKLLFPAKKRSRDFRTGDIYRWKVCFPCLVQIQPGVNCRVPNPIHDFYSVLDQDVILFYTLIILILLEFSSNARNLRFMVVLFTCLMAMVTEYQKLVLLGCLYVRGTSLMCQMYFRSPLQRRLVYYGFGVS
jgi:hypothetical protein